MAVITNLVSYWDLNESSGNAIDPQGGNDLTDNNPVGSGTGPSGSDGARTFNGSDEYFSHADNAALSVSSDFAFAAWFKTSASTGLHCILCKDDLGSNREYNIFLNTGIFQFDVFDSSSGDSQATYTGFTDGAWHLFIAQYEQSDKKARIYIDDTLRDTGAAITNGPADRGATFEMGTLAATFFWSGSLSKTGFWKKVLTSGERTWLYNSGAGRSYADIVAEAGGGSVIVDPFGAAGVFGA